ncbi:hypothetical protein C8R44DRAFT_725016 [Mycena epipterygia]|nr:hypothetical protein C8R44DRAFT_725016 [Mycena epipterygia]
MPAERKSRRVPTERIPAPWGTFKVVRNPIKDGCQLEWTTSTRTSVIADLSKIVPSEVLLATWCIYSSSKLGPASLTEEKKTELSLSRGPEKEDDLTTAEKMSITIVIFIEMVVENCAGAFGELKPESHHPWVRDQKAIRSGPGDQQFSYRPVIAASIQAKVAYYPRVVPAMGWGVQERRHGGR